MIGKEYKVGLLTIAAGTAVPAMAFAALALAPVIIGLGYGPITPASSHILARTAHPSRMALTFSIKQTGVPAVAAIAGAALPVLALQLGWQVAFAAVALLGIPVALLSELVRRSLDVGHVPSQRPSLARLLAPLRDLVRGDAMRELAITAFLYAALQVCLVSFIVVYLTESLHYSLVAAGLVSSDGFAGLRAIIDSGSSPRSGRSRPASSAGRWFVLGAASLDFARDKPSREVAAEMVAWMLLHRYGVVFRRLATRETTGVTWRELVRVYRRLEDRGEIRGGRFVAGFDGEQYALPEAVTLLRAVRRREGAASRLEVSAADPLNLVGVLTPDERVVGARKTVVVA